MARNFLPSAHEWYKAAYYDPTSGGYFNFLTGSDTAPTPVASGTAAGTAVCDQPCVIGPADITLVGGLSPYGTMSQGGNVWEWEETDFDRVNGPTFTGSGRDIRGGSWLVSPGALSTSNLTNLVPSNEHFTIGFRVASVPEPSAILQCVLAGLGVLGRRRLL